MEYEIIVGEEKWSIIINSIIIKNLKFNMEYIFLIIVKDVVGNKL